MLVYFIVSFLSCLCYAADPGVSSSWVFLKNQNLQYAHMSTIETIGNGYIACAYQASPGTEGALDQKIYMHFSGDDGFSWGPQQMIVEGNNSAVWGPALYYDEPTKALWMFYSESGPFNLRQPNRNAPGGDIKYIVSKDNGISWSQPVLILPFYDVQRGNISKMTANKMIVSSDGSKWLLPFWQEAHTVNDTGLPCAGVLISEDKGETWKPFGFIHSDEAGWLIENAIVELANHSFYQVFRTKVGYIWQSMSTDGGKTWSPSTPTSLLNPNSKVYAVSTNNLKDFLLTYNPVKVNRTPLVISISQDQVNSWNNYVTLGSNQTEYYSYPTTMVVGSSIYTSFTNNIGIEFTVVTYPN